MTNLEKLHEWFENEKENGLQDFKASFGGIDISMCEHICREKIAAEILNIIEASNDPTKCKKVKNL